MKRTVRDVMTTTVVVVPDSAPYKEILRLMHEYRVSALPVVDGAGLLCGIVSEADLMLKEDPGSVGKRHLLEGRRRRVERSKATGLVASQLMTAPVYTIGPKAVLAEAARRMHDKGVKRLPVIDPAGHVLGVVSRVDILRVFLRADEEIEHEVREETLHNTLMLPPGEVHVRVHQGLVVLDGQLERRSQIGVLLALVRGVEGVVGVEDRLSYREDDMVPPAMPVPWMGAGLAAGR